jgi:hypothetical protein
MEKEEIKFPSWLQVIYIMGNEYYAEFLEDEAYKQFVLTIDEIEAAWQYEEAAEEYYDLEKGYARFRCVFKNISEDKLYATDISYCSYEGWEQAKLEWFPVTYTERVVKDYHRIPDAEDTEK